MEKVLKAKGGWNEPAHALVVQERNDLAKIYAAIKDKCQVKIDSAFDSVSRQVGFVVTAAVPIDMEIEAGKVKGISMGAENLQGTIFEKEMVSALKPLMGTPVPIPTPGAKTYRLPIFWKDALMLEKVVVDPNIIEPVHEAPLKAGVMRRAVPEPAHFGMRMPPPEPAHLLKDIFSHLMPGPQPWMEQVLASAIDEVYPELNFAQRLAKSTSTAELRLIRHEPVQLRPDLGGQSELTRAVLTDMAAVLRKHGY